MVLQPGTTLVTGGGDLSSAWLGCCDTHQDEISNGHPLDIHLDHKRPWGKQNNHRQYKIVPNSGTAARQDVVTGGDDLRQPDTSTADTSTVEHQKLWLKCE